MILFKKDDLNRFASGKSSTLRGLKWNQAKEESNHQLRLNFDLPPFAFADVEKITDAVKLTDLTASDFAKLGVKDINEYFNAYGFADIKKRIDFKNIVFNPDFDFASFGICIDNYIPDLDAFLSKYIPLIGKPLKDNIFDTKKDNLTGTKILNLITDYRFKPMMQSAYLSNDADAINDVLFEVLETAKALNYPLGTDWLINKFALPFSLGNSKIGADTLCISINSALLCHMGLIGKCDACNVCYAVNSNRMYSAEYVKNSASQLRFNKFDAVTLAESTIKAVKSILTKKQLAELRFIRFNVNGDIRNQDDLMKLDKIAGMLMDALNIKISYSYTHNKELDLSKCKNIVINSSFKDSKNDKNCLIKFGFDASLMDDDSVIVCNGKCFRCSYCKNPNECRTIIFLAHGGKYKGIKEIPAHIMEELEKAKELDYIKFCKEFGIEC
ncbi:MAG: hypothetical protein J6Y78_04250 [Paludibacteraceae bacterium]|nr:hypothetical protein [Paludibacteraceae bacterium]